MGGVGATLIFRHRKDRKFGYLLNLVIYDVKKSINICGAQVQNCNQGCG